MMIEMKYQKRRFEPGKEIVLNKGVYKGHKFIVLNLGTHPTAYVENKIEDVTEYYDERFIDVEVNGGFTYFGTLDRIECCGETVFIGWDYAHCWDWDGCWSDEENIEDGNVKHTTSEMTNECLNVIDQLIEIEQAEANINKADRAVKLSEIESWLKEKLEDAEYEEKPVYRKIMREIWKIGE